ncbi:MAG: branched-chain amino acid ABC transporter permease [Bacteriovoracaceae bacterium]|nr:branched-chain amino acid ABC transporter permease [Bacteriovoracaceae bacterium]
MHYILEPFVSPYVLSILIYSGINIILALSLNLVTGFTGQFSIGHAGFMAIGSYASALLSLFVQKKFPYLFSSFYLAPTFFTILILGGIVSAFFGYLVGLPSLRLRGDYLAIVTLGFGEIIRVLILNIDSIGGARGLTGIPHLTHLGWVSSFVLITCFVLWRVVHSSHGRAFLSIREDEIAAEAMGVNTTQNKVKAFVLGAFFAGIAGGLFAHYLSFLAPSIFDFNRSFEIIIMVVLGGLGSFSGSIFAAIFLTSSREFLRPLQDLTHIDFRMILYSLMLIILMLTRPHGLFGSKEFWEFLKKKRKE